MRGPFKVTPEFLRVLSSKDPRIQLFLAQNQLHFLQMLPVWGILSAEEQLFLQSFYYRKVSRKRAQDLIDPRPVIREDSLWCSKEVG